MFMLKSAQEPKHYSSLISVPVPPSSLKIQSHVPVPHFSGESSPVFRDNQPKTGGYYIATGMPCEYLANCITSYI